MSCASGWDAKYCDAFIPFGFFGDKSQNCFIDKAKKKFSGIVAFAGNKWTELSDEREESMHLWQPAARKSKMRFLMHFLNY